MNNGRKISLKYVLALIFAALFFSITLNSSANYSGHAGFDKTLTAQQDTVPKPTPPASADTLAKDSAGIRAEGKDTIPHQQDTLSYKISKDSLDGAIEYTASDSVVLDVPGKKVTLYNKANTKYKDLTLDAYKIQLDQVKQVVVATYTVDTANQMVGKPKLVQADNTMQSDTIVYNLKTQKGLTRNTYTQSGEMYILGEKMKKVSENVYFAYRGRFTTCNLDTPHFAFRTNKLKLINKKFAISGPIHPEFEGVPVPIYLPFGFFPISDGRHSGLLPPAFDASPQFGLGLTGLGYYKILGENFDVVLRANIYSYGGWNLYLTPEYRVRYRYSGRLNFTLQKTSILSNSGKEEFDVTKTWSLAWAHTVDSKAHPGQNFSANVNLMSTKFNQFVYNNPTVNFTNQIGSSISYSKTWNGKYNLTLSGTHNQNNATKLININLPNLGFTATTIYPLQKKEFVGTPKWYEKLGIGLTTTITGGASFYDSLFSLHKILDTFQWGASHNIPISLSLPPIFGGAVQIGPGISLAEKWYSKKLYRTWNPATNKLDTTIQKGFFTAEDLAFSLNVSTAIFGTFTRFGKKSSILGIRHVIRPTIGISYKPDLSSKFYYTQKVDTANGGRFVRFSVFDGSTYGPFAEGTFGGISFGLDNNLEMKVKSKTDTTEAGNKKVKLIDGFGFNGSYNYLADSFKLSPISFYIRSTLFGNFNITGGATLDPYVVDSTGFRTKVYAWDKPKGGFSLGRITSGNIAISTSFKSKPKDSKKEQEDKLQQTNPNALPMTPEEQQSQLNYIRANPGEFADFNIAWSVNISYSLSFTKVVKPDYSGFKTELNSSLNLNGDFNLTENWKVGFSCYYDVKNLMLNSLTTFLSRNLHCWQMTINVTPVGPWRSFNVTLSPKSGILRDLKVNRSRQFQ
ncbi:MAG TPA: putative LPS assembly protein LptD [Puia sp.]|nr:putative LPS assembly protein LptD [Puia sp.]